LTISEPFLVSGSIPTTIQALIGLIGLIGNHLSPYTYSYPARRIIVYGNVYCFAV